MKPAVVRVGVAGGTLGGIAMALWSMVALWLTGGGFWTPLNLIAHTARRAAPLDARFSAPALVIGLVMHMMMAAIFGTLIALATWRLPGTRSLVIAGGMILAAVLWAVMQYGVWRMVDSAAARDFTPWIFAIAHLVFGMLAATAAAIMIPDELSAPAARGAHSRRGIRSR